MTYSADAVRSPRFFCTIGFHRPDELLVDAVDPADRIYRCKRCGVEWSPTDDDELVAV